jgi:hypothetical protein
LNAPFLLHFGLILGVLKYPDARRVLNFLYIFSKTTYIERAHSAYSFLTAAQWPSRTSLAHRARAKRTRSGTRDTHNHGGDPGAHRPLSVGRARERFRSTSTSTSPRAPLNMDDELFATAPGRGPDLAHSSAGLDLCTSRPWAARTRQAACKQPLNEYALGPPS